MLDSNSFLTLNSNRRNQQMTVADSSAIATSLASLVQAIFSMNTCADSASRTSTDCTHLIDPYDPVTPFALSSQSGSTAYASACAPLSKTWDGQVKTFHSFTVNVRIHVNKVKWNSVAPHGILSFTTGDNNNSSILTEYQSIYSVKIVDAFTACNENRAVKNSKALYAMLSKSVTITSCNTVFEQAKKLPTDKDGITLFKLFTSFTVIASIQL